MVSGGNRHRRATGRDRPSTERVHFGALRFCIQGVNVSKRAPKKPDHVERWRKGPRYYWHRKAAHGRIVSQGGPYWTSWGALRGARRENPDLEVA